MQVTIAHERRSVLSVPGFRVPAGDRHPSHSAGTVQESTASALVRENNERDRPSVPLHTICQLDAFDPMRLSIVDLSDDYPNFPLSRRT